MRGRKVEGVLMLTCPQSASASQWPATARDQGHQGPHSIEWKLFLRAAHESFAPLESCIFLPTLFKNLVIWSLGRASRNELAARPASRRETQLPLRLEKGPGRPSQGWMLSCREGS